MILSRKIHPDAKNSDQIIPDIISKYENDDSGTDILNGSKDPIIFNRIYVIVTFLADLGAECVTES